MERRSDNKLLAIAVILTRARCHEEHPLMLSLGLNLVFVVVGGLATVLLAVMLPEEARHGFLLGPWVPMGRPAFP